MSRSIGCKCVYNDDKNLCCGMALDAGDADENCQYYEDGHCVEDCDGKDVSMYYVDADYMVSV